MSLLLSLICRPALPLLALALTAGSVRAGSITADSVMSRTGARQDALEQVPKGATVTSSKCQDLQVGMDNTRYRCTVWFTDLPKPATPPKPATSAMPAPPAN